MRRYHISDLGVAGFAHVAAQIVPGERISKGGLSFHQPGQRTHDKEPVHVHSDHEVFCIMQGRGWIEINGQKEPIQVGDVLVVEPGENHHIVGDPEYPIVNLWFHTGK